MMKYVYFSILILMSIKSVGKSYDQLKINLSDNDSLLKSFQFYSFNNDFPIAEGKKSVYNVIIDSKLGIAPSLVFNYPLKKALIDYYYIGSNDKVEITADIFKNILWNSLDLLNPNKFKNNPDYIKNSIFTTKVKLISKTLIKYDNSEYYIGEVLLENGKTIKNGYGAFFYKNGDRYEGYWVKDKMNGEGCVFSKSKGQIKENKEIAYYLEGIKVGRSINLLSNGDLILTNDRNKSSYYYFNNSFPNNIWVYEGQALNDVPNGEGVKYTLQHGKQIKEVRGFFVDGKISVEQKLKPDNGELTLDSKSESENLSIASQRSKKEANTSDKFDMEELKKNCLVCLGTGIVKYCICQGKGFQHCKNCRGTGYDREGRVCLTCKRSGITTCSLCKGRKKGFKCDHITWYLLIQGF